MSKAKTAGEKDIQRRPKPHFNAAPMRSRPASTRPLKAMTLLLGYGKDTAEA